VGGRAEEYRQARETHLHAALIHQQAASFWAQRGYDAASRRELQLALGEKIAADIDLLREERAWADDQSRISPPGSQ
jgi:hypothetical protein